MMRVWDQAGNCTEESKRFYLHMSRRFGDLLFVYSYICVVFLIAVDILDKTLLQEILKRCAPTRERL